MDTAGEGSVDELLTRSERLLRASGLKHPEREAVLCVAGVLGISSGELAIMRLLSRSCSDRDAQRVRVAVTRRARREPLQHILGSAPFMDFELAVGPGVFVPRYETESLVEIAIRYLQDARGTVIDIGSGSGTIAIALARALPEVTVVALEASPHAWPWLQRNIRTLAPRVQARFGSWDMNLPSGKIAAICTNPPYIPQTEIPRDPEVRCFDPAMALYSGEDGLGEIRRIASVAAGRLRSGGFVITEHTEAQGDAVQRCFTDAGLRDARTFRDLTDRPRFTVAWQQ